MRRSLAGVLIGSGLISLLGCGTVINVIQPGRPCAIYDHPQVYGGVRLHAEHTVWRDPPWSFLFSLIDLPLSVAGDTITLPYTVPATVLYKEKTSKGP